MGGRRGGWSCSRVEEMGGWVGGKTKGFTKTKSLSEGKGGVWVYEAYEVKNKREKLRCLLLRRKKKNIFFIFMM
jgi:hypothetical protein